MDLKRSGFAGRLVSHGMHSIASATFNEHGFEPELIELALAHAGMRFAVPITVPITLNAAAP